MKKQIKLKLIIITISILLILILSILDYRRQESKNVQKNGEIQEEAEKEKMKKIGTPKMETEEVTLYNVKVIKATETELEVYFDGETMIFQGVFEEVIAQNSLADITYKGEKLQNVRVKSEKIYGKILSIKEEVIEIEGYGELVLDKNVRVFQSIGEIIELSMKELMVGYEGGEFYVAEGQVCGIAINTAYSNEHIRVLLKTNNFADIYHAEVILSVSCDFTITYGDIVEEHTAGEVLIIQNESPYFITNRMKITPASEAGEITIQSLHRAYGNPSYLGSLEIEKSEYGFLLINELPLEQYLYSVVPSEMPTSYSMEALKAQAICARSYAIRQMEGGNYEQYGAHVDDSVQFQVYNNMRKDNFSIQAVNETMGKVVVHENQVVTTFYYSTSGGHTSTDLVWGGSQGKEQPYLHAIMLNEQGVGVDLSNDDEFYGFIMNKEYPTYDMGEAWYRWSTVLSLANIATSVNANLGNRQAVNPDKILVLNEEGEYIQQEIETVGDILKVFVEKRKESGAAEVLIIVGTAHTIRITSEYNIRALLAPNESEIIKNDETIGIGLSLLPSAYVWIEPVIEEEALIGYAIIGGGYGHGVGMSQNGAKNMAEAGFRCEEILKYFYKDVEIVNIYE